MPGLVDSVGGTGDRGAFLDSLYNLFLARNLQSKRREYRSHDRFWARKLLSCGKLSPHFFYKILSLKDYRCSLQNLQHLPAILRVTKYKAFIHNASGTVVITMSRCEDFILKRNYQKLSKTRNLPTAYKYRKRCFGPMRESTFVNQSVSHSISESFHQ